MGDESGPVDPLPVLVRWFDAQLGRGVALDKAVVHAYGFSGEVEILGQLLNSIGRAGAGRSGRAGPWRW